MLNDRSARCRRARPGQTALIDGDPDRPGRRLWTYAELLADAQRAARALLTLTPSGKIRKDVLRDQLTAG